MEINLRSLTPGEEEKIEILKEHFGRKTYSGTVRDCISVAYSFHFNQAELEEKIAMIEKGKAELSALLRKINRNE